MAGKAERILDAAEALLISFGYRRVTVDEVARRAGVGKGTVYLYWPSKAELFGAVLTRHAAAGLDEQLAAMRADPAEVLPHRMMRRAFLEMTRKPLARALYTGDYDILGELLTTTRSALRFFAGKTEDMAAYLSVLHRHGLLADDPATDPVLPYRLSAATAGSYLLERATALPEMTAGTKADALATTVRRAFEPAGEPDTARLRAAADETTELLRRLVSELTATLPTS